MIKPEVKTRMKRISIIIILCFAFIALKAQFFIPNDTIQITYKGLRVYEIDNNTLPKKSYRIICNFYPQYKEKKVFISKVVNFPFFLSTYDNLSHNDSAYIVVVDSIKYYAIPPDYYNYINQLKKGELTESNFKKHLGYCFLDASMTKKSLQFDAGDVKRTTKKMSKDNYILTQRDKDNRSGEEFNFKRDIGIDTFSYWHGYGNAFHIIYKKL